MKIVIQNQRARARALSLTEPLQTGWINAVNIVNGILSGQTSAVVDVADDDLSGLSSGEALTVNDRRIRADTVILADAKSDLSNFTITTADGAITFTRA